MVLGEDQKNKKPEESLRKMRRAKKLKNRMFLPTPPRSVHILQPKMSLPTLLSQIPKFSYKPHASSPSHPRVPQPQSLHHHPWRPWEDPPPPPKTIEAPFCLLPLREDSSGKPGGEKGLLVTWQEENRICFITSTKRHPRTPQTPEQDESKLESVGVVVHVKVQAGPAMVELIAFHAAHHQEAMVHMYTAVHAWMASSSLCPPGSSPLVESVLATFLLSLPTQYSPFLMSSSPCTAFFSSGLKCF